jgi:hypothetical protein
MESRVGPILTCRTNNCDVRSNQDTEFNIKRCYCKVCLDEAGDVDDNRQIMTQWSSEDIDAAKLKGQQIAECSKIEFEDYDSREDSDFIPEDPHHTPVYKNDQVYIQSLIDTIKIQNQQLESLKVEYFTIYRY